ncbi:MAG: signal recognition particle, subunit FFH/SRP54 [Candidatus Phytoplasma pruni]|uniref:signal recognition particle protein n=1 Tax=Poinsettia branch-inducing phytoplasma TaxID=138647 RepID=UPI00037D29DE|nr:signal recognition particle receptor subunit alpha [Poinsettia branch-inducing phytoplasma]WEK82727.1 MAG: signal recognition particle, subunit FFH/SRP54 [Candidatus Phytoplasma pruni]
MSILSRSFQKIMDTIKGKKHIQEKDLELMMKDIRLSFLEADVNYDVITHFNHLIKEKVVGKEVLKGLEPQQQVVKIINEVLTTVLGSKNIPLQLNNPYDVVLLVGLQGSGKTTTAGKLAYFVEKKLNKKVLLIAADTYRPGAVKQLVGIGEKINIDVFFQQNTTTMNIIDNGLKYALHNGFETVIIDTTGRSALDQDMLDEIKTIKEKVKPSETLIVADSLLGQQASVVAKGFHEALHATGVIMTKMDADIKGGSVLSIKYVTNLPIKFMSSSEKHDDDNFEIFYPDRMSSRLLGMGDMLTLIEQVEDKVTSEQDKKLVDRLLQDDYNYHDLQKQFKLLKKIGSMKKILNFIPGIGSKIRNMPMLDKDIITQFETIIQSMTKEERLQPQLIQSNNRRRCRIAKGSGNKLKDVNLLIDFIEKQKQISKKMGNMELDNLSALDNPEELLKQFMDQN